MGLHRRTYKRNREFVTAVKHELELYLISAQNLEDVSSCFGRGGIQTYAVAWVQPDHKLRTSIDNFNGQNPNWNAYISLSLDAKLLEEETTALTINIYNHGCLWDKLVGTVRVLVSDLINGQKYLTGKCMTFMVMRPSGRRQGQLHLGIPPSAYQLVDSFRKETTPILSEEPMQR
ncbi:hypothetical protein O6H91_19G064300 [Diphasiastrum complanatum]|uniref:Uncharacterized protein n=1 Tax=Diphasiastrum complanatum TaxID=34168 RepID=A0ACC2AVX9_DIPCM|nr:hypothetical protein O6H91_19G064300 [Diphasiastrum complanatum]